MGRTIFFTVVAFLLAGLMAVIIILPLEPKYILLPCAVIGLVCFLRLFLTFREIFLCVLIFSIPFQLGKFFISPELPPSVAMDILVWIGIDVIDCAVIGLYILWILEFLFHRVKTKIAVDKYTTGWLLLLIAASCVSLYNASATMQCVYQSWLLLRGILIFFYIAYYPDKRETLKVFLVILASGVLIQGCIGLIQYVTGKPLGLAFLGEPSLVRIEKIGYLQPVFRISGTFACQNLLWFMYMDFVLPLLAALLLFHMRFLYRLAIVVIFLFGFFISSLTFSRGGWISFFVSIVILLLLNLFREPPNLKMFLRYVSLVLLFLVPLLLLGSIVITRFTSYDYGSFDMRKPLADIALNIIQAHPIVGIGAGNYLFVMYLYDISVERLTYSQSSYAVHNLYLFIAAELGMFGLLSFIFFIMAVLKRGLATLIERREGIASFVVLGLMSGICGFCVHSVVEAMSLGKLIIFWVCCGLIIKLSRMKSASDQL